MKERPLQSQFIIQGKEFIVGEPTVVRPDGEPSLTPKGYDKIMNQVRRIPKDSFAY